MFLSAHAAGAAFLAARRQWIHRIRPDSVQGSDLHMMRYCIAAQTRAYGFFSIGFSSTDDADFDAIIETITADLTAALADPRASLRRGMDLEQRCYNWRSDLTIDGLVETVDDDADFYRIDDDAKREIVFRFHRGRRVLGCIFDHTCWDGIRVVNECVVPAIRCQPFSSKWLLKDQYTPGVSEALMIYTGYRNGWRALTHRGLPTYDDGTRQKVVQHVWSKAEVKRQKNALGTGFNAMMVALFGVKLFDCLPASRTKIRFGLVVGFDNPRFRNNYSMVAIEVYREHGLQRSVRSISKQIRRRRAEVMGLYHLVNTVEVETLFKTQLLDVLFSPTFFDRDEGLSLRVSDMHFFNVPCSTPVYAFTCSIDDRISMCTTINCPEIDLAHFSGDAVRMYGNSPGNVLVDETPPVAESAAAPAAPAPPGALGARRGPAIS